MLQLKDREWKEFNIREIFPFVKRGKRLKTADHVAGDIPYVSSSAMDNGVDAFIGNDGAIRKFSDCLTLANSGSVGITFYHCYEFIASDHVTALQSPNLNKYSYIFIATMVKRLQEKYSFNREINDVRLNKEKVFLPVDDEGKPDYAFMEEYIREREEMLIQQYISHIRNTLVTIGGGITPLQNKEWKAFTIDDIFEIKSGKRLVACDMKSGNRPFIGATDNGNGITHFVSDVNESLDKNVLGVNYNGNGMVIGFYHPYECIFSDDVKRFHLKNHEGNPYVYLFIKTILLQQKSKYSYGYKFSAERMKRQYIMLPVDFSGTPDWNYMEEYARQEYNKVQLQYLQAKNLA